MSEANGDPSTRVSARVILLSSEGEVLLIRFAVLRSAREFVFWATPGGGVELGETPLAAAHRELLEELQLETNLEGPVHSVTDSFEHKGSLIQGRDIFFVGRCDRDRVRLHGATEEERSAMQTIRWWKSEEIEQTEETVFPKDLAQVLARIARS
ncbi:NUDIX domain-containing protein [Rhodopseudomonas palustris]|uniref:NUDIX domain-containing protein n=1 Tax=Rhodopseudomonas palustris TaxID=1076 RepID=UPI002ACE3243|nr:NUDIX domain-containing protein [Rhodopseudomonas palustris]WQH00809.1 NUDIX domain-containing protein [Rhodopseudomonas palustris]